MKYVATAMLPGALYCCTRLYDIYDLDFIFGALTSRRQVKLGHPDPLNRLQALRSSDDSTTLLSRLILDSMFLVTPQNWRRLPCTTLPE